MKILKKLRIMRENKKNAEVVIKKGKVGNIRYYTIGNEPHTRTASKDGGFTRTLPQAAQRYRRANIKITYDYLKDLLPNYFERPDPSKSISNEFSGMALKCTPIYLTTAEKEAGYCIAAPYIISFGTLSPISYMLNSNGILQSSISLGNLVIDESTSVGEFAEAVVENNGEFKYGDCLSFFAVKQVEIMGDPTIKTKIWKVQLQEGSNELLYAALSQNGKRVEGFSSQGGFLSMDAEPELGCYAWIHTREKKDLQASTQALYNANKALVDKYRSDEQLLLSAQSHGPIDE